MKPSRIVLLLIAILAGGLAAFLATRGSGPAPEVQQLVATQQPASGTQVLVATGPIGVGQRLSKDVVAWQPWPADAVRPEYITIAKSPDAPTKIVGTVARFEIFPGEPINDGKLVHSDQGYLSAVLDPGMRGVSVNVSVASGSGGFIIPNDRVDVLITDSTQGQTASRVILSDVKILAIGTRLGQSGTTGAPADPDPKTQVFTSDSIATLELTPSQAETLITATSMGKISLVLRSIADFGKQTATTDTTTTTNNQTVRIIRFGRQVNVTSGADSPAGPVQATVSTAAFTTPAPAAETPVVTTTAAPVAAPAAPAASTTGGAPASPATAAPSGPPMVPTIQ